ncbi:MAG: chemotaxis protein CheB, partial [Bryobacteraceae bacterium]
MSSRTVPTKSDHRSSPFPVVGIGASAGGLDAVMDFLAGLDPHTGMGFILLQHLEPHHESHLPEILSRETTMPVLHVKHGMRVEPDQFYVVPPNAMLTIAEGILQLSSRDESTQRNHGIDQFFFSLAEDMGSAAIGIILSGSASDGAQGIRAIKCASGITFCQTEDSAKFGGMPHSAIATGAID